MIIYSNTKCGFINDVENEFLVSKIEEEYNKLIGGVNNSELRSWKNSLMHLFFVLCKSGIPDDCGVAIEYNIPSTSKRVDFIITGRDNYNLNMVLIELKQWESVQVVSEKDGIVMTFLGGKVRETTHPSYQAWSYASYIKDFNSAIYETCDGVIPCAYLHNYDLKKEKNIISSKYNEYIEKAPVFTSGERTKLTNFIKKYIKYSDNGEMLDKLENGKIKPSKSLQDALKNMLLGNKEFIMLDDQKVVYEMALNQALKCNKDNKKRVMIVEGGPGTGKSVIAINLLVDLINKGLMAEYVTKNSAPREVYAQKLSGIKNVTRIKALFKGSGSYINTIKNEKDVLIVDESHRLNEKSGMFKNKGENQIKEIINSSLLSIFFIDENQKIHIDDFGSISEIKKWAKHFNAEIIKMELKSQFRCNGSDGYISWIDNLLQIDQTGNFDGFDDSYDFRLMDSPNELFELIKSKNTNNKARMLSGYCWDWDKNHRDNSNHGDIIIGNFKKSWNLGNTKTWAIDKDSVNEVGCIHTSQGLEFEYVGVIIGDDLRYENNRVITDFTKRASTDRSLWGIKGMYKKNKREAIEVSDKIIRNTYRTLLTRGQKGCYVYCTDENLKNYIKNKLRIRKLYY